MPILIKKKNEPWRTALEVPYGDESGLQKLLYESPELIPVEGGDDIARVFIREAGLPGSGSTDLLGVDATGNIYVVECKLAANAEIRRKVIGQVFEYDAFLWRMTLEDFDRLFVKREKKSLIELMRSKAGSEWDPAEFQERVSENLQSGSFFLLIAVDKINTELERIIRYLGSGATKASVSAIEMRIYANGDISVLAPQVHGLVETTSHAGPVDKLTLEEVLDSSTDKKSRALLETIVNEWKSLGHTIEPGTKGISFRARIGEKTRPVFWAPNPEFVNADFNWLNSEGVPPEIISDYKAKLSQVHGFDPAKVNRQVAPRAYLEEMSAESVRALVKANDEMVRDWAKSNKSLP